MFSRTLKNAADEANPNKVPQVFRGRAGKMMAGLLRFHRGAVASNRLELPDGGKAVALVGGTIIAGGGGTGAIDPVAEDAAPASGQATITPDGSILFAAADAVTEAEVWYFAYEADAVTVDIVVDPATGLGPLSPYQGTRLLAAEALTGGVTGDASIVARGDAQPLTGECRLNLDGENVEFLIADAVTAARVTFIPRPGFGPADDTVAGQMDDTVNF